MKKLMFATALVASAAAFADPAVLQAGSQESMTALNAISFEGYAVNAGLGSNGTAEMNEDGQSDKQAAYFCYEGEQDGSTIKAFGAEGNAATPSITRPNYFATATPNAKYLELSTEGGILWRSINAVSGSGANCQLGTAQTIGSDGLYLDTLVQFTPTEDGGSPEVTSEDKLAIWLNVDSSGASPVTNLMVRAKRWSYENETLGSVATNFTVSGVTVVAGTWYRLTIKAIQSATQTDAGIFPAFQIFIDGTSVAATSAQYDSDLQAMLSSFWQTGMADLAAANKLFPSLAETPGSVSAVTLQGVGFKGSGALDDIVWTTEDPFANSPTPGGYAVEIGGSPVPITPTAEDFAAIAAAAAAAGIQNFDTNNTAAVNALLATPISGTGEPGIPAWQAAFLGLEPTTNGLEQVAIKSISFDEDGKVVVEMADAIQLKTGRGVYINLILKGSNDLSSWTEIETVTDTKAFSAVTPAVGETKKFYKVEVEFSSTPPDNNNN